VAAVFGVDAFLLDLDAWLAKSAPERRRDLMGLVEPFGASIEPGAVLGSLNGLLAGNPEWAQILGAVPDMTTSKTPALDWLRMVEETAKARVAQLEKRKDGAEARLRTARDNPLGMAMTAKPARQIREEIADLDGKIEEAGRLRAAADARLKRLTAVQSDITAMQRRLPVELRGLGGENLAASYAAHVARRDALVLEAATGEETAERAKEGARAAHAAAEAAFSLADGRLRALMGLSDAFHPGKAGDCPVCGSRVDGLGTAFSAKLLDAQVTEADTSRKAGEAADAFQPLDSAHRKARLAHESAKAELALAKSLRTAVDRLIDLGTETATEGEAADQAPAVPDDVLVAGWRDARQALRTDLDATTRLEERAKLTEEARVEAETAETARKHAAAVVKAAGPSGVAGDVLGRMLGPVLTAMAEAAPPHLRYGIRLFDERGGPDAMVVLNKPAAGAVPYAAMSGGERAMALAAFAAALSKARPDRKAVILIEAGEIDTENLHALCAALSRIDASNIVIATHHEVIGDEALAGFEVRKIGGYAA
jgi:DNA repair exonuclease SbcCD ATPase subunit